MVKPAFGRKAGLAKGGFGSNQSGSGFGKSGSSNLSVATSNVSDANVVDTAFEFIEPVLYEKLDPDDARGMLRNDVTSIIEEVILEVCTNRNLVVNELERRDLVTVLLNDILIAETKKNKSDQDKINDEKDLVRKKNEINKQQSEQKQQASQESIIKAKDTLQPLLLEFIDASAAGEMERSEQLH
jgi:hypothetical protein